MNFKTIKEDYPASIFVESFPGDTWIYILPGDGKDVTSSLDRDKAVLEFHTVCGRLPSTKAFVAFIEDKPKLCESLSVVAAPALVNLKTTSEKINDCFILKEKKIFYGFMNEQQLFTIINNGCDPR